MTLCRRKASVHFPSCSRPAFGQDPGLIGQNKKLSAAVCLSGGSAFGLEAASGVARELEAQRAEIAQLRKRTGSTVPVFADVYEVHGVPLCPKPVGDAAWECVHEAFADGLFMSGKTPAESIQMVQEARRRVPDTPIFLGGGATGDNVRELMRYYDGVSVATWIKNGDMKNPIDPDRARIFLEQAKG